MIAAAAAYFIKGLCGFANTLVFTTILSFGVANVNISPIDLLLGYPANVLLTWQNRKKLDPKVYIPLSLLVLLGSIPGALLLKNVDTRVIKLIFGVIVCALGLEMLVREYSRKRTKTSRPVLILIGILSGVLCGLFGVGALLAAYVGRVTTENDSFKANISAVFIADNTFRILLYGILHVLTPDTAMMSLKLFPAALLGLLAGIKCSHLAEEKTARKITAVLLVLSGISLILKNL